MKLSGRVAGGPNLYCVSFHRRCVRASQATPLRIFVGGSLVLGGGALAAEAEILRDLQGGLLPGWVIPAVLVWIVLLALVVGFSVRRQWPWPIPAAVLTLSLTVGVVLSNPSLDLYGHDLLSALAPFIAVVTGIGVLLRERWSWPVAFASVVAFGPIILVFAPLPLSFVYVAAALFVADALMLLVLAEDFFSPERR